MRHSRTGIGALVAPVLAVLFAGCTLPGTVPFQVAAVVNQTDSEVVVFGAYPTGQTSIVQFEPGESDSTDFSGPDGCAPAPLIARTASGLEVDRLDEPFCVGDRWEIQN